MNGWDLGKSQARVYKSAEAFGDVDIHNDKYKAYPWVVRAPQQATFFATRAEARAAARTINKATVRALEAGATTCDRCGSVMKQREGKELTISRLTPEYRLDTALTQFLCSCCWSSGEVLQLRYLNGVE